MFGLWNCILDVVFLSLVLAGLWKLLIAAMDFLIQFLRLIAGFMIFYNAYVFLLLGSLRRNSWYLTGIYFLYCLLSLIFLHFKFLLFRMLAEFCNWFLVIQWLLKDKLDIFSFRCFNYEFPWWLFLELHGLGFFLCDLKGNLEGIKNLVSKLNLFLGNWRYLLLRCFDWRNFLNIWVFKIVIIVVKGIGLFLLSLTHTH